MEPSYKHLTIEKELLVNTRRTRKPPPPFRRDDIVKHAQHLGQSLTNYVQSAQQQVSSTPGTYILKLNYSGNLTLAHLAKHGVEFISQEGSQVCIAFADEKGLSIFADHIQKLGQNSSELSYKQILEALDGIENWTKEDRSSWSVKNTGFPETKEFLLDIELWPLHEANHPKRLSLCAAFETWLTSENIASVDKVNLDSLLMYRVKITKAQANVLLNHKDIRFVDLIPITGISYQQQNRNISTIPSNIPSPPANAAKVCILDSGINTNHPLLAPAIAESASFVDSEDESDTTGHGTSAASIALYGDIEACETSNSWQPLLWLYNGKVMFRCPDTGDPVFDTKTIESTLIEVVEYFKELGCRVFNLSIGNENAPYDGKHIRGIAYVLDTLARQHNILFVVSAGNFKGSEKPPVPSNSWRDEYPEYLVCDQSTIIDPAPALNVLTVGSLARHNSTADSQRYSQEISQLSPASEGQPSPFTRHGPSVNGAFKPELMAIGGNLASPLRHKKQWQWDTRGLGVLTCHHEFVGKTLFKEVSGTSFAAPYITHLVARFLNDYPDASANLLRAVMVNHAILNHEINTTFSEEMRSTYKKTPETKGRNIARDVAGYGAVDEDALFRSTDDTVVLISEDSIENNAHQFYELPLHVDYLRKQKSYN